MTSEPHLRLHVEELPAGPTLVEPRLAPLLAGFERATGWQIGLEHAPAGLGEVWSTTIDGCGRPAGRLVLRGPRSESNSTDQRATEPLELSAARPLALALANLLSENNRLRHALWQREAELAAGVPVSARPDGEAHLAERLTSVLKSGADAIGCQAAGLYLLDETTSVLKLRAAWGLPESRLLAPPRQLRGAVADLEALVGHAVALEDTSVLPHWRCPEDFPAAVCVPVSSPTIPLGTLWLFSDESRDFSPEQTNLLEIIAGRLAADLEREMLLTVGTEAKQRDQQLDSAARWQAERLPSVAPLVEGYEVAGWTQQTGNIGGDFHDWSVLADGRLSLAVGDASGPPVDAMLGAAALQAAVKAHAAHRHSPGKLLARVNDSIIAASPGDQRASLAYAVLDPKTGTLDLALAGGAAALHVGPENRQITTTDSPQLGETLDATFDTDRSTLQRGETLVLISGGVHLATDAGGLRIGEPALAAIVAGHPHDSATALIQRLRRLLQHEQQVAEDMTLLVVKRRI